MGSGGDELERGFDFGDGAESVARAGNEERRRLEAREMGGSQFLRALRRMEWVGEQEKSLNEAGFVGGEHGRLPAAVGMAAEEDTAGNLAAHGLNCCSESGAVTFCTAALRRPVRTCLAEWKIAAENG